MTMNHSALGLSDLEELETKTCDCPPGICPGGGSLDIPLSVDANSFLKANAPGPNASAAERESFGRLLVDVLKDQLPAGPNGERPRVEFLGAFDAATGQPITSPFPGVGVSGGDKDEAFAKTLMDIFHEIGRELEADEKAGSAAEPELAEKSSAELIGEFETEAGRHYAWARGDSPELKNASIGGISHVDPDEEDALDRFEKRAVARQLTGVFDNLSQGAVLLASFVGEAFED